MFGLLFGAADNVPESFIVIIILVISVVVHVGFVICGVGGGSGHVLMNLFVGVGWEMVGWWLSAWA